MQESHTAFKVNEFPQGKSERGKINRPLQGKDKEGSGELLPGCSHGTQDMERAA